MAAKKKPAAFTEVEEVVEEETTPDEVVIEEPVVVVNTDSDIVNARVKGTWVMFWGTSKFDFEDGKRYKLPKDLFNYLRSHGNIYDTL
jgi:Holliday junction resolvasome RuvABC endonuclease subunit